MTSSVYLLIIEIFPLVAFPRSASVEKINFVLLLKKMMIEINEFLKSKTQFTFTTMKQTVVAGLVCYSRIKESK